MKQYFGEYRSRIRAKTKALGRKSGAVENMSGDPEIDLLIQAEQRMFAGEAIHWFIATPELADHLACIGGVADPRFLEILADEGVATGVIHTCGLGADGILFSWQSEARDVLIVADKDEHQCGIANAAEPVKANSSMRLLFGLAVYLNCFPAAVRDGFPEFAKHQTHYKGQRCAVIDAVAEIIEREGPTPHFRKGHPRILRSERFTKKRWQVVWVGETFIKGKVKTVREVEPKEQ